MALIPEDRKTEGLMLPMTVGENLTFAAFDRIAPHGLIDVRALDCDFLACSPYKFYGPHAGMMYGKREHLKRLRAYRGRMPEGFQNFGLRATQYNTQLTAYYMCLTNRYPKWGSEMGGGPSAPIDTGDLSPMDLERAI